jgi:hypothetical protein
VAAEVIETLKQADQSTAGLAATSVAPQPRQIADEFLEELRRQEAFYLAAIFDGGLERLDEYTKHKYGTDFLTSKLGEQTAVLDLAYGTRGGSPEVAGGSQFFTWTRNMVVDAYYTSPVGVKDIGYMGNTVVAAFSVPQEAVDYVLKRSPFGA